MLNNSEIALPIADVPGEEFLPLFTQLDPISKGPVNLKYPTYSTPFSTVLLGNSPQSSNAKPKKNHLRQPATKLVNLGSTSSANAAELSPKTKSD